MLRHFMMLVAMLCAGNASANGSSDPKPSDRDAITTVINSYTQFVGERNRKGFETLLLDKDVPFSSVTAGQAITDSKALQSYAGFDSAIFAGDFPYRQHFSNVKIDQVGPIAQVSLNFTVERVDGKDKVYAGWKILQFVKSNGAWKIASELWTFDLG